MLHTLPSRRRFLFFKVFAKVDRDVCERGYFFPAVVKQKQVNAEKGAGGEGGGEECLFSFVAYEL